ncbi:MAG TPA: F0F1 ATP synthase subunit delta [Pseudomonadales bacterium]|nr:F0F1 ATP synthase subunit delta [Pseudomonadales bacterium]
MAEAEEITIARPYARAVFSCALEHSSGLADWSRMLAMLAATVQQPTVVRALDDPHLSSQEEAELLGKILGEELTQEGRNLLSVLGHYGRIAVLPEIAELFEDLKAQHDQVMDVLVTSAYEIDESDKERLVTALKERLQKKINLTTEVDPTLLGGAVIRAEDTVIDDSVRGKLARLSQVLN